MRPTPLFVALGALLLASSVMAQAPTSRRGHPVVPDARQAGADHDRARTGDGPARRLVDDGLPAGRRDRQHRDGARQRRDPALRHRPHRIDRFARPVPRRQRPTGHLQDRGRSRDPRHARHHAEHRADAVRGERGHAGRARGAEREFLANRFCTSARRALGPGVLVGRVREPDSEVAAVGARVSLVWYDPDPQRWPACR